MQRLFSVLACLLLAVPCLAGDETPGYTIITTSAIRGASSRLNEFIAHKQSLGFDVQVITEADFGGGIGDTAAENIRAWLQSNYVKDNIEYVLLIGDPRPDIGEIPMKMLWPTGYDPNDPDAEVPSDAYYADLTANWDLDGDGNYGEWGDDFGAGGVDRQWEVMVARIPCYKSDSEQSPYEESVLHLDYILEKTIDYENETLSSEGLEWRKNVLLGMNDTTGSCLFGESIKDDILIPAKWSYHRVYHYNIIDGCEMDSSPETIITSWPCEDDTPFPAIWGAGKFGLVIWSAHGNPGSSQCIIKNNETFLLNDEYPSFTFQLSCHTGTPEDRNNLAYALLKQGAICTVASTRKAYNHFTALSSPGVMAYEYTSRIVAGMTSGEALYTFKERTPPQGELYWTNYALFNIYGDPSLRLAPPQSRTVYVDDNANGINDGSSWESAYVYLQDALAIALPGDEIRVARGTYKPDQGVGIKSGDRYASFNLKNGVELKGGYAGTTALDPDLRDIELFETTLSGNISEPNNTDNSHHVVSVNPGVCEASILDGFTITCGYADSNDANGCGGGIYINQAHPILIDCNITSNVAVDLGGGIYNHRGNPRLTQCTFSDNSSLLGGGIYNQHSNPLLWHTRFIGNVASNGGGIYNFGYGEPALSFCEFKQNSADIGAGMFNDVASRSTLNNCIFSRNQAELFGGGTFERASTTTLLNCTFSRNSAVLGAGAVYNFQGSKPKLTNCILWGDTPDEVFVASGQPLVTYSNVQTSDQLPWPGEGNIHADPCFAMPGYWDLNDTPDNADDDFWVDGDYHLKSQVGRWDPNSQEWVPDDVTSPCIDAGNPGCSLGDEPNEPSNIRINMGAYGGTAEASKSAAGWRSIADLTNDFEVDFSDFGAFARYWLDHGQCIPSDLNRDRSVDLTDLVVFADTWLR